MKWLLPILINSLVSIAVASEDGRSIYLLGSDSDGKTINAVLNDLESGSPLACVNCHRESGLGSSESGITIPPASWRFLSQNQPTDDRSRFYSIQNKRPAYTTALLHRLLTTGINSKGEKSGALMPRYDLTEQQTGNLIEYLKTLFPVDDPGVNEETIKIATVIDSRLPNAEKKQHREFLEGLFRMKNSGIRGELRRKKYSPIQKAPQYEAYRKWELLIWELPADTGLWGQVLNQYYLDQPVFVVLAPLVKGDYASMQGFCRKQKVPCLFPHRSGGSSGDYYNFVYRDSDKQRKDYIASKLRSEKNKLLFLDGNGKIENIRQARVEIPKINNLTLKSLADQFDEYCAKEITLILATDNNTVRKLYELDCPDDQKMKIKLLSEPSMRYQDITAILGNHSNPQICWVTNYDKVLKRNLREIRVSVMVKKFGINHDSNESLAQDLYAFGLLTDSIHQLAGNFSRTYLLEIIEHMLNSYPNFTYFSSVSGAPYQRAIVGPFKEYCPGEDLV